MCLFVCQQWLLDSRTAGTLGGKDEKLHKVIEMSYQKVKGSFFEVKAS